MVFTIDLYPILEVDSGAAVMSNRVVVDENASIYPILGTVVGRYLGIPHIGSKASSPLSRFTSLYLWTCTCQTSPTEHTHPVLRSFHLHSLELLVLNH